MITRLLLQKNHLYKVKHMGELYYGNTPQSMFINGEFNPNNWSGGDAVIRQFLSHIEQNCNYTQHKLIFEKGHSIMIVDYKIDRLENHHVHIFTIDDSFVPFVDEYYFSWYKHRGHIECAFMDCKPMTSSEYVTLLNNIEKLTDFQFEFYVGRD